MTRASSSVLRVAGLTALLGLAACAGGSGGPQSAGSVTAPAAASADTVIDLLNQGNEKDALKQIKLLQKRNANDPAAAVLLESIKSDPVQLLGAKSFAYTVQPGDTMVGLSQRFLGNRLKFYQLARYNHVAKPAALAAGTVLRVPGEPPRPPAPPKPEPVIHEPAPSEAPKAAKPKKPVTPAPAATKAPAANPAAALKLRGAGLAALNQGKVADAVGLLRRALALDPANPLIARDLARASRIAQTVQSHR